MKIDYQKVASYEAQKGNFDKILLLYSGGLDTSVMVKWIQDNYDAEIYTLTLNIGQVDDNFDEIKSKAKKLGVKEAIVMDVQQEFAEQYLIKAIKANADYQHGYHLYCPLGRAVISQKVVELAHQLGIQVIAHGCTGKGNDQVRFDSYITTLDPGLKILAPVREWSMTRLEELKYAETHNIPIKNHSKKYSYDENLWGDSGEGSEIEDVSSSPDLKNILLQNQMLETALSEPSEISIEFKKGVPVALNGKKIDLVNLIKALASLGAAHGIGTKIFVEDRVVGLKVRSVYEQPAAHILINAHQELEKLVSTSEENEFKTLVDQKWAYLCYGAKWFSPLMQNLNSYIEKQNEKVSGKVTLKLYKGNVYVMSMESDYSLLDKNLASFDCAVGFNQQASAGFIEHYNFQQKMAWQIKQKMVP